MLISHLIGKNTSSSYDISCEKYVLNKESDVEIFNAISINNNGKNDYLYIRNVNLFPKNNLFVFDINVGWFTNRIHMELEIIYSTGFQILAATLN